MNHRQGIRGGRLGFREVVGAVAILSASTCYRPSVVDGKLMCGPAGACPDGFLCQSGICRLNGETGPSDAGDAPVESPACVQAVAGCVPSETVGACDPVCQTGCGCHEKCSVSSAGVPACVPVLGSAPSATSCAFNGYGTPAQDDTCAPGSVCLRPGGVGDDNPYCFSLCRSDADCPQSRCGPRAVAPASATGASQAMVCDVPVSDCNPFTNAGCPMERPVCYLTTPDPSNGASRTVCEYSTGPGALNTPCGYSRDCFPRFACPRDEAAAGLPGVGACQVVCNASNPCDKGTCQPYGNTYGYCVSN